MTQRSIPSLGSAIRLATVALVVTASIAPAASSAAPRTMYGLCPRPRVEAGVVICNDVFTRSAPLHLPRDPSRAQRYGAFARGGKFVTRAGAVPVDDAVMGAIDGPSKYANQVFLATIRGGKVVALKVVAKLTERAILKAMFSWRTMEGTIGLREPDGTYSFRRSAPLRLRFGALVGDSVKATIVNAERSVRSANGSCMKSLQLGASSPLVDGYTANVSVQRVASMHGPFNDELVLKWTETVSNMGDAMYPSVATLLDLDPLGPTWDTVIHGTPNAGPPVALRFVRGGGRPC